MLTERINEWAVKKIVKSKLEDSIRGKQVEMVLNSENSAKDIVKKLTELIDTLNKDFDKSKEENNKLQAENTDLKDIIKELNDKNSNMNKELNNAMQENKDLEEIIKELKTKNYELSMENNFVKKENNKLQDKLLDAAIGSKDKNNHAYIGLAHKYEQLQDENKSIKETVSVVNNVVKNVEKQNVLLKNRVTSWHKSSSKEQNNNKVLEATR